MSTKSKTVIFRIKSTLWEGHAERNSFVSLDLFFGIFPLWLFGFLYLKNRRGK